MKLTTLVVACLAPLGLSATTVANPGSVQPHKVLAKPDRAACGIVNTSSKVNCRKGAGTKYDAVASVTKGTYWFFDCVQTGECVTIDGSSNWYVQIMTLAIDYGRECQLTRTKRLAPPYQQGLFQCLLCQRSLYR